MTKCSSARSATTKPAQASQPGRTPVLSATREVALTSTDVPIWRVEVPGPEISRDPAGDARVDVSLARSHFNELAADGTLRHWADAYERGHVRVSGDPAVTKLLGNVIQRQLARSRT
jgi:hypothetical protein